MFKTCESFYGIQDMWVILRTIEHKKIIVYHNPYPKIVYQINENTVITTILTPIMSIIPEISNHVVEVADSGIRLEYVTKNPKQ